MENGTLQLKQPFSKTAFLALVLAMGMMVGLEVAARSSFAESKLPARSIGSTHMLFELKLARLDHLVENGFEVDCLIVGSSLSYRGIDPLILEQAYHEQTGETIRCFNFGLGRVTASEAGILADILAERYTPRWIIFGTTLRDYDHDIGQDVHQSLIMIPWTQQAIGNYSFPGWLSHYSYAYGYHLTMITWLRSGLWRERIEREMILSDNGFTSHPYSSYGLLSSEEMDKTLKKIIGNFTPDPADMEGFDRILALKERGVEVILVEMPLPADYKAYFDTSSWSYSRLLAEINRQAQSNQTLFIQTTTLQMMPNDVWYDFHHLNTKGAALFSSWLGSELGKAVTNGTLTKPTP